jgi:hypothetical protein
MVNNVTLVSRLELLLALAFSVWFLREGWPGVTWFTFLRKKVRESA